MAIRQRDRLGLSLDVDDLDRALDLARSLAPYFRVMKIGYELYAVAGPRGVEAVRDLGFDIFLDLKLHDIPTTVERGARALGRLGVQYLNFHTQGGLDMLRAGVDGFAAGASDAGYAKPIALGVTVLTSDADARRDVLATRMLMARDAGCGGVVCAATDLGVLSVVAPELHAVVPGVRPEGSAMDDQARTLTPAEALDGGAHLVLLGRPVTRAEDPVAAAANFVTTL